MKLSTTVFALVSWFSQDVAMALDEDSMMVDRQLQFGDFMDPKFRNRQTGNGNGNGNGNSNGNGNGPPDCVGQARAGGPPDHVLEKLPEHVIEKFNNDNHVKPCRTPAVQEVTGNSVKVGGNDISLDDEDLTPLDIFSKGARVFEDGEETVLSPLVFQSKLDSSVTVTKGVDGKLMSATKRGTGNGRGVNVDILPLSGNYYAELDADDVSDDILSQFSLEDAQTPPILARRKLSAPIIRDPPRDRSLQTVYDVVELDIVLDSYFCAAYGGNPTDAQARAISIVVEASKPYELFNVRLKIKSLTTFCNAGSDPIRSMINSASGTCGGFNGLLEQFTSYVSSNSGTFSGDLVHLFYGFSFGSAIGCAYLDTVCDSFSRTGVNEMTYTGSILFQGILLAHEVGHNLSAEHFNNFGFIMYPSVCSSCTTFSSTSRSSILNAIDTAPLGCISQENDGPPTPAPTPFPTTAAPVPAPTNPAPPVCMDDPNFYVWLCGYWCFWADCYWFSYNYPEWYCGYQIVYDNCPYTCYAC